MDRKARKTVGTVALFARKALPQCRPSASTFVSQHLEEMREMCEQGYFDCGCEECDRAHEDEEVGAVVEGGECGRRWRMARSLKQL